MTFRRQLAFASLAACAVALGLLLVRHASGTRPEADAAPRAETNAPPAQVSVTLANRTLTTAGFPTRFCEHQSASARGTAAYVLVLADGTAKIDAIRAVRRCGARAIGPLPPNALLVETDVFALGRMSVDGHFAAAAEWLPADKLDARLAPLLAADGDAIDVTVVALASDDVDPLVRHAVTAGGERLLGCLNGKTSVTLKLPRALAKALADRGDVRWIEPFSRPKLRNDLAAAPAAMNVEPIRDMRGITGAGQLVTTSDSGIDTGDLATLHEDLRSRVIGFAISSDDRGRLCFGYDADGHGTHTAGSLVGDGTRSDGKIRGAAPGAKLWAWFCGGADGYIYMPETCDELFRPAQAANAAIHSASWGLDDAGAYDDLSRSMDEYVWEHPDFLPVVANGNVGPAARTVGSPATAKNVLAVGATGSLREGDPTQAASFSSRGPCVDGRIKPDVCAPGQSILSTRSTCGTYPAYAENDAYTLCSGTSMATPLVAGAAALVRQWLVERRGFTNDAPTAALVKAVLTGGTKDATVPDDDLGWGRLDLGESLYPSNRAVRLIDRIPFTHRYDRIYTVSLTNAAPFDVQLVWIDYPATAGSAKTLVNDLDLIVSNRTTGAVWTGNAVAEGDRLNTVESVRIPAASTGDYDVIVRGYDVAYDSTQGGAAALYLRGAFDGESETDPPETVTGDLHVDAARGSDATGTGSTNAPFATIAAALARADANRTIRVAPGTYAGTLTVPAFAVRIVATDGPAVTFLDGGGTNRCYDGSQSAATVLSGFTLANGYVRAASRFSPAYGAGAYGGTLTNCVIRDCTIGTYGYGGGAYAALLTDCRIENCRAGRSGGGACESELRFCTLAGCTAGWQGGGAAGSKLRNVTVRGCRAGTLRSADSEYAGGGVDCQSTCSNTILWDNVGPTGEADNWEVYNRVRWDPRTRQNIVQTYVPTFAWCCTTPFNAISENSLADDPRFVSTNAADATVYEISPCLGSGEGGVNIGAYLGPGAVKTIPTLDAATASGEEVSNAVASVGFADKAVERGIGTNGATYAAFSRWSTNGLNSTAVVLSPRAYDSFLIRDLVTVPTLLAAEETSVEFSDVASDDGACTAILRLLDGAAPLPLRAAREAFAAFTRVGAEPGGLAPVSAERVTVTPLADGERVKLSVAPPQATPRYFLRFNVK